MSLEEADVTEAMLMTTLNSFLFLLFSLLQIVVATSHRPISIYEF